MIDSIKMILELSRISDKREVINHIYESVRNPRYVHQDGFGNIIKFSGKYKNLFIRVNEHSITIENSLSRYYFGNNTERLGYATFKKTISKLSEELKVDISKAKITQMDLNIDIYLSNACEAYYDCFVKHKDCGTYHRLQNKL